MRILKAPKVYLIARPQIVEEGLNQFLKDEKLTWPTPIEGVKDAERLVEVSGRICYMSYGKKAGSKTNKKYIQNLLGVNEDGTFKPGPAHGSVCEHPCWSFLIVGAGRGFCYDDKTEVLTGNGWKYWSDISGDELFCTKNSLGEIEYQLATNIIREKYEGRMIGIKSKMVDLIVTPNHRMYCSSHEGKFEICSAEEIYGKKVKFKRNALPMKGDLPSFFTIPDYISCQTVANQYGTYGVKNIVCNGCDLPIVPFAKFIGYWLSEGSLDHCSGGGYNVVISQNNDSKYYTDIEETIKLLGLPYSIKNSGYSNCKQFRISGGRALYEYLKPYSGSLNKAIPLKIKKLDNSLLKLIVTCHMNGDGSYPIRGSGEGYTISKLLADDLQELALKCGFSATIRKVDRRHESPRLLNGRLIKHNHIGYVVSYCKVRNEPMVNHNKKQHYFDIIYNGVIYCATVPNGLLYVRRNGRPVWCGNSHEQVRHRTGWAYSQLSTRYCDFEREEEEGTWEPGFCIPPLAQLSEESSNAFAKKLKDSQQSYCELLALIENDLKNNEKFISTLSGYDERERKRMLRKAARGAARDILPIATEAILVMSANARAIWNCIVLRANEHAEAVIREIYVQISKIMEVEMPSLFNNIKYEVCWDGSECVIMPRDKL